MNTEPMFAAIRDADLTNPLHADILMPGRTSETR